MANPYYIPRPQRESRVFQLANAAIGLGNLKNDFERTNIMKEQGNRNLNLLERRADQELGERGTIQQGLNLQGRQVGVSERAATLAEQKFDFEKQKAEIEQQKVKRLQTPLSAGDLAVIEAQLPRLDNVLGFGLSKAAKSYVNRIKAMSEGGATRMDLYYDSKQNWPNLKRPLLEEAKKGLDAAVKDGDQKKVQTIKSTIDAIESGEFLRMIFPQATTYDEQLQATREQELKKTILTHPSDQYETFEDQFGNRVQRNTVTGEEKKISSPSKGMEITTPEGTTIRTGVPTGAGTKKTQGTLEEKILGNLEQYNRVRTILDEFKPEYQEIGNRLAQSWTGLKASFGQNVSKEERNQLIKFKRYKRKAIENINLYIKEITGAQMSENEADRLRQAQPDPGEKWWNGDDPITFQAKAEDIVKYARAAAARYQYYLDKSLSDSEIKGLLKSDSAISLDDLVERMQ